MTEKANIPDSRWMEKCHFTKGASTDEPATLTNRIKKTFSNLTRSVKRPVIPTQAQVTEPQEIRQEQQASVIPAMLRNEGGTNQDGTSATEPAPIPNAVLDNQVEVPTVPQPPTPAVTTRSGRTIKPTQRSLESQEQRKAGLVAYYTPIDYEVLDPLLYREEDLLQAMDGPIAFNFTPVAYKA